MRGVGFKLGRWEIFKVSLHSWQRGTPFFMKIPYITYPLFQILSTPLNHPPPLFIALSPPTPIAHCSLRFLVSLTEWMITPHLMRNFT